MILDDFKDGRVVLCVTSEALLKRLLQWCDRNDMKWIDGTQASLFTTSQKIFVHYSPSGLVFGIQEAVAHTLVAKDFEFTYDDLVPGMIVETRAGVRYLFVPGNRPFINLEKKGSYITRVFNGLTVAGNPQCDVVKVYKTDVLHEVIWDCKTPSLQLVWERDPEKEALRKKIEGLRKELLEAEVAFETM